MSDDAITKPTAPLKREKVRLHLMRADVVTVESLASFFKALTGREVTPEEAAEVKRILGEK